jgi:hypothetical protein
MGDAVLRALESEGIVLDTSVGALAPIGFSFLGECKSIPGVSRKSLSVWHAPYSHLPLTIQDAERLVMQSPSHSRSLLASERPVPPPVRKILEGNDYEVWGREEIIRILGKAQLSIEDIPEEAEGEGENAIPPLNPDSVLSPRIELRTILETLRIEGITRPILLEVRAWAASATLIADHGERMAGSVIVIENPWTGLFHSMAEQGRPNILMERMEWAGRWSEEGKTRNEITARLDTRASPSERGSSRASLLQWYRTDQDSLKMSKFRAWVPGWVLTASDTGKTYAIEGLTGKIVQQS